MAKPDSRTEKLLEKTIFASRWLQAPLYVGLIIAQAVYVWQFMIELMHLVHKVVDGKITLWRDYFDMFDMVKATVRGLIGGPVLDLLPLRIHPSGLGLPY